MRVNELAKQIGITSKELLRIMREEHGIEVKSHSSAVDDATATRLTEALTTPTAAAPAEPATAPAEPKPVPAPEPQPAPEPPPTPAAPPPDAPEAQAPPPPPATDESAPAPEPVAEAEPFPDEKVLHIRGGIVVKDLADLMNVRANRVVAELMRLNTLAAINDRLDFSVAEKAAAAFGYRLEHEKRSEGYPTDAAKQEPEDGIYEDRAEDLQPRPPVVTFLGHVDHGKTSLLDVIRKAAVAAGESGGITQHIGAYTVDLTGQTITFLDTPGHAAFTAMRARGANLTDIAVIIVAADDGIMPQTREAIAHAREAGVSIMVAINKIDLPAANKDRVLMQLQQEGLAPEDWGGETICCPVSAETGEGIDHLLDMIQLQAEVLELKANPKRPANGFVIEASMEPGMGPTANLLVTGGTLKVGDAVLCGPYWGRVRALINDHGVKVKSAGPSTPVQCLGLSGVPEAGSEFTVLRKERNARQAAETRAAEIKHDTLSTPIKKASLDDLMGQLDSEQIHAFNMLLKADTQGSVEAILHALSDIQSEKINLRFIHSGTGNINTNDVMLASASNAVILGFHTGKEAGVDALAKREGIEIRLHQVIYELIDQVKLAMLGILGPRFVERVRGRAEIRQVFDIGRAGKVAGCLVTQGSVVAKLRARVIRKNDVQFEGGITTLKHFQDVVAEVREAQECGIRIPFDAIEVGDIIECYELEQVEQTL